MEVMYESWLVKHKEDVIFAGSRLQKINNFGSSCLFKIWLVGPYVADRSMLINTFVRKELDCSM